MGAAPGDVKGKGTGTGVVVVIVLILMAIGMCTHTDTTSTTKSPSTPSNSPVTTTSSSLRVSGQYTIVDDGYFGCVSREDRSDLIQYLIQHDEQAFTNELATLTIYGEATVFKKGEVVFLMDTKIFSGLVQVRREGETTKYWTSIEAIK